MRVTLTAFGHTLTIDTLIRTSMAGDSDDEDGAYECE